MPELRRPSRTELVAHVLDALGAYWPVGRDRIERLPVADARFPDTKLPLKLRSIPLPDWACSSGVSGALLVPEEACGATPDWDRVDWFLAAVLMLEGWHERVHESLHGPIHSYSFRLSGWDTRLWDHAWVNRVALFLRLWAAHSAAQPADELFGSIPRSAIAMTHDVDAIGKTLPIRLKQAAFNLINAVRALAKGRGRGAAGHVAAAARFLLGRENWWTFDDLLQIEKEAGFRSRFHFYADGRGKTPRRWLFDPGYAVSDERVRGLIGTLEAGGWRVGLHPSFDAWASADLIGDQRTRLDSVCRDAVKTCRQHWLRFSWGATWLAQASAGLEEDSTLMFNDRMGLRTASAVRWHPWDPENGSRHELSALPTVLMDSHAYDYGSLTAESRRAEFRRWLSEVNEVGGQCAVLWHPHTLSDDYGWSDGFRDCVGVARELDICLTH